MSTHDGVLDEVATRYADQPDHSLRPAYKHQPASWGWVSLSEHPVSCLWPQRMQYQFVEICLGIL